MAKWDSDKLNVVKQILSKHFTIKSSLPDINKELKEEVTEDSLSSVFRRNKLESPSNYLATSSDTLSPQRVADLVLAYAEENKVSPADVTWQEFTVYIKETLGNEDLLRIKKVITAAGGFYTIRDAYFPPEASKSLQEKFRLKQHASLNRKLAEDSVKQKYVLEEIEKFSSRVFKGRIAYSPPAIIKDRPTKRVVTVLISDTHFGSDIDGAETGVTSYGVTEEARCLSFLSTQVNDYKIEYRDQTELEILLAGDIIQGQLRGDTRDGAVYTDQCLRALHILSQFIGICSKAYKKINVRATPGNHGRIPSRHPNRATLNKWDSFENIIYGALKSTCSNLSNVQFFIPKTPYAIVDYFGSKAFVTHFDTTFTVGSISKIIQTQKLESQVNALNNTLPDRNSYRLVAGGHVHTPALIMLSCGTTLIVNGAMCPVDPYGVSIGMHESTRGQWIWESTADYIIGDSRLIRFDQKIDNDRSLDKIIKKWGGF